MGVIWRTCTKVSEYDAEAIGPHSKHVDCSQTVAREILVIPYALYSDYTTSKMELKVTDLLGFSRDFC